MRITVVGAGNMGASTARGLLASKCCEPQELHISDPSSAKLQDFKLRGVATFSNNIEAAKGSRWVMVFVKPWLVEHVLSELKPALDYSQQNLVVVAAGVKGDDLCALLEKEGNLPNLFLVIPNIAIEKLCSMTFVTPVHADQAVTVEAKDIFAAMGEVLVVEERLLAAGTTLASCGLAYAMRYVRAASEGGVEIGFYPSQALSVVLQTVKGAVALLQENQSHPEAEIDKVTTPGGVTIRGLNEMEKAGFTSAVIRGIKAGM